MTEKTTTIYTAFDGKEFKNKNECEEYEKENFIQIYDKMGKKLELNVTNLKDYTYFIRFTCDSSFYYFKNYCLENKIGKGDINLNSFGHAGLYIYDSFSRETGNYYLYNERAFTVAQVILHPESV